MTLLAGAGAPAGLTVHRERTYPIEKDTLPSILIYLEDDPPRPIGSHYAAPLMERSAELIVECRARGNPPDASLDPLIVWATQTLVGNEKFSGLGNCVEEGKTTWSSKTGDDAVASATIRFTVKYRTSRADPTVRS